MYFVDRTKIEEILTYMDHLLKKLETNEYTSVIERLALERIVQMMIESMIDVGNMMIDGFIMRDPGSYEDIIDILVDESVLTEKEEDSYKAIIALRKMLVKEYMNVNHDVLKDVINQHMDVWKQFSYKIREYLNNELGVANAFSNE